MVVLTVLVFSYIQYVFSQLHNLIRFLVSSHITTYNLHICPHMFHVHQRRVAVNDFAAAQARPVMQSVWVIACKEPPPPLKLVAEHKFIQ